MQTYYHSWKECVKISETIKLGSKTLENQENIVFQN